VLEDTQGETTEEEHDDIKWTASAMYISASDSTAASIYAFFLAMVLFPGKGIVIAACLSPAFWTDAW